MGAVVGSADNQPSTGPGRTTSTAPAATTIRIKPAKIPIIVRRDLPVAGSAAGAPPLAGGTGPGTGAPG
ncbi:hypothetical protein Asp14428_50930 [Actinoplanes sp. NBRC 14428]|nr:hypothetical protein Asp14428_50930 [Actinoplanes sp. NBRC 14428]